MKDIINILLLGSGGRECAIAWKLSQSPRLGKLYIAPGNAARYGTNIDLDPLDFPAVAEFVEANDIDMIVVGPEVPLVEGIADFFADSPVKVIGPCKAGARLAARRRDLLPGRHKGPGRERPHSRWPRHGSHRLWRHHRPGGPEGSGGGRIRGV